MNAVAILSALILLVALLTKQLTKVSDKEGFVDYIVYGPGWSGPRGPWYAGRWRYQPWWGYRRHWWNELYEPAPWGPCPGPWCPYR